MLCAPKLKGILLFEFPTLSLSDQRMFLEKSTYIELEGSRIIVFMVLAYAQVDSFVFCYKNLHKYLSRTNVCSQYVFSLFFKLLNQCYIVNCVWKPVVGFGL